MSLSFRLSKEEPIVSAFIANFYILCIGRGPACCEYHLTMPIKHIKVKVVKIVDCKDYINLRIYYVFSFGVPF